MSEEPPPDTRPTWNAETIVEPDANVSGSTSVLCWAWASVKMSWLTWVTVTFARATVDVARASVRAEAGTARSAIMRADRAHITFSIKYTAAPFLGFPGRRNRPSARIRNLATENDTAPGQP